MRFISFILLTISLNSAHGEDLPKLMTKQSLNNIRYISHNGKITYYQNESGELKVSTNYKVELVSKAPTQTQYLITPSKRETWLGIELISNPHRPTPTSYSNQIYISKLGSTEMTSVGSGKKVAFHLEGTYFSYFEPNSRSIKFGLTNKVNSQDSIKIFNKSDPYFVPRVYLITPNDVLYNDVNSKGLEAILVNSVTDKKVETLYKTQSAGNKLEFCLRENHLIVGEFPRFKEKSLSRIMKVDLFNNPSYSKVELLYTSPVADIGNLTCTDDGEIFFIKTLEYNSTLNAKVTDVANLEVESKKVTLISKMGNLDQLTKLGKYVLAPHRGEFYIVSGKSGLVDDSIERREK